MPNKQQLLSSGHLKGHFPSHPSDLRHAVTAAVVPAVLSPKGSFPYERKVDFSGSPEVTSPGLDAGSTVRVR